MKLCQHINILNSCAKDSREIRTKVQNIFDFGARVNGP